MVSRRQRSAVCLDFENILSLDKAMDFLRRGRNLPELNVARVVVGHPDFLPAIAVEVREGKSANSTLGIFEDSVFVLESG